MDYFSSIEALDFSVFCDEHRFKVYPNWMLRYFETLSEKEQWLYFLEYRKVASLLNSERCLIEQLKWILKSPSPELEYDFYVQFMFDPEGDLYDSFKPGMFELLDEKYRERFETEFKECWEQGGPADYEMPDLDDELPF